MAFDDHPSCHKWVAPIRILGWKGCLWCAPSPHYFRVVSREYRYLGTSCEYSYGSCLSHLECILRYGLSLEKASCIQSLVSIHGGDGHVGLLF